MKRFSDA
jgi:hypothetical protein